MRKFYYVFLIVSLSICVSGYKTKQPPKMDDKTTEQYLKTLYNKINILEVVTTNPNGNYKGRYGQTVMLFTGGNYYLETCISTPNGTSWRGIQITAVP